MTTGNNDPALSAYLRELRWALAGLPANDRDEILAEVESHLLDRVEQGVTLPDALAALGSPVSYAKPFVETHRTTMALTNGRVTDLMPVLAARVARSARAALGLVIIAAIWIPTIVFVGTAGVKLFHPEVTGLWVSNTVCFVGTIDDPSTATELLGMWIFPVAALLAVVSWALTHHVATRALSKVH